MRLIKLKLLIMLERISSADCVRGRQELIEVGAPPSHDALYTAAAADPYSLEVYESV